MTFCSAHGTTPCLRETADGVVCIFDQCKPDDGVLVGPPEVMVEPRDKHARHLLYRRPDGSEVLVPNVHYNQPVAWRVEHLRWRAQLARERANFYQTQPGTTARHMTIETMVRADELEAQARALEAGA